MKPLLYNYYIDYTKKDKTRLIILCLLHELRVISVQQLIDFFQIERLSAESTVYKHLNLLKTDGLI
ncbi:ArsR family transcriptional regulator, partial [Enterococcus faecalis]|nr:ArsR family transcriptional regulator [Enterococcus faecalis]